LLNLIESNAWDLDSSQLIYDQLWLLIRLLCLLCIHPQGPSIRHAAVCALPVSHLVNTATHRDEAKGPCGIPRIAMHKEALAQELVESR